MLKNEEIFFYFSGSRVLSGSNARVRAKNHS